MRAAAVLINLGVAVFYLVSMVLGLIWSFQGSIVVTLVGGFLTGSTLWFLEFWCWVLAHYDLVGNIGKALGLP